VALVARGYGVRVLARGAPAPDIWGGSGIEVVHGDLADAEALARLADGAQVLVHAAGAVKARRRRDFFRVNAEGSAAVSRAIGDGRMVLISSLSAREPGLSPYAASKRAGEDAARAVLGSRLTVLRPPAIYGPADLATLDLFRLARVSPVLPVPGAPHARLALAFVDDVAEAVCDLVASGAAPGPFACGGARPSGYAWREIMSALAHAAGRKPRLYPLPDFFLLAAGALGEAFGALAGRPAMFSLGKAREFLHPDWSVDPKDEPPGERGAPTPLEIGFARTAAWYLQHGWVK
jgi:nucleoside-diphosphate-sugar epimerase